MNVDFLNFEELLLFWIGPVAANGADACVLSMLIGGVPGNATDATDATSVATTA